ncbi:MAG: GatB/YqeY domain-containing protein [Gammaproteobacteria bacterium]|nr:GatB/YqeY domain-containing protein [Gammaproteobacteria bacterium]
MTIKTRLTEEMKRAMKGKEKQRLAVIRLIQAAVKQREVDERIELDDTQLLQILDKMKKQRRDSITAYSQAGRDDLVAQEEYETTVIDEFLPQQLTPDEIEKMVVAAIAESGAEGIKEMGKVMAILKPQLQGRADIGKVSGAVKAALT